MTIATEREINHAVLLVAYMLPLVILSKQLAVPIDLGIAMLDAPVALGGFLVAVVVLSPESLSAARAALANELQRSVNILLGSVLATISLTIPAVLVIGFVTGRTIVLGLEAAPPAEFFGAPKTDRAKLFLSQVLGH